MVLKRSLDSLILSMVLLNCFVVSSKEIPDDPDSNVKPDPIEPMQLSTKYTGPQKDIVVV